jgi:CheY-like chemotaxis protein
MVVTQTSAGIVEASAPIYKLVEVIQLLEQTPLDMQQRTYIKQLYDTVVMLHAHLPQLRADTPQLFTNHHEEFHLKERLQNLLIKTRRQAGEYNLEFIFSYDRNLYRPIVGDWQLTADLISEGFDRAFAQTSQGYIKLECRLAQRKGKQGIIAFQITDTGKGIEKSRMTNYWEEPENQSLRHLKQQVEGAGGRLKMKSELGFGTQFSWEMAFSFASNNDTSMNNFLTDSAANLAGMKILLVEDLKINQMIAQSILEEWGAQVVIAENGQESLDKLQDLAQTYDLVLMDVQMPVMDGLEATQQIRQTLKSEIPIIALTANTRQGDREECIAVGMNDYLPKPFQPTDLWNKIQAIAARKVRTVHVEAPLRADTQEDEALEKKDNLYLYDLATLSAHLQEDKVRVMKMLQTFIERVPTQLAQLKENYLLGDLKSLAQIAHQLKSVVDLLQIFALKDEVQDLIHIHEVPLSEDRIARLVQKIMHTFQFVLKSLQKAVQNMETANEDS